MGSLTDFTLLVLIGHFLGDYQLQAEKLSKLKTEKYSQLGLHILLHGLILLPLIFFALRQKKDSTVFLIVALIIVLHFVIDILKKALAKKLKNCRRVLYLLDQALHLIAIYFICEILFQQYSTNFNLFILNRKILNWLLLFILITKPANISFKIIFEKYQYLDPETNTVPGAGAIIGNMERILSAIFLATDQITAIGLIYTAKSIARFKQIEENKKFAEYYLIGTLYSILYLFIFYYLIFVL